jgi:hypothetical protein
MFPRNVGSNAIVFFQAWLAGKTLEGGRDVQFAIKLEKVKFDRGKWQQIRQDRLRVAMRHQGASSRFPRFCLCTDERHALAPVSGARVSKGESGSKGSREDRG